MCGRGKRGSRPAVSESAQVGSLLPGQIKHASHVADYVCPREGEGPVVDDRDEGDEHEGLHDRLHERRAPDLPKVPVARGCRESQPEQAADENGEREEESEPDRRKVGRRSKEGHQNRDRPACDPNNGTKPESRVRLRGRCGRDDGCIEAQEHDHPH
jgi:hypothetical protein